MSTCLGFVPDDRYIERGYIADVPRLYPAVRFDFKPLPAEQRMRLVGENTKLDATKASRNVATVLAKKIASWDLKDGNGEKVEVSPETLLRIKPALYDRLLDIVMGLTPCDEDQDAVVEQEPVEQSLADELGAAAT